jgi:hypothetical protein
MLADAAATEKKRKKENKENDTGTHNDNDSTTHTLTHTLSHTHTRAPKQGLSKVISTATQRVLDGLGRGDDNAVSGHPDSKRVLLAVTHLVHTGAARGAAKRAAVERAQQVNLLCQWKRTCFTSTKVQILTHEAGGAHVGGKFFFSELVQKYKY